jgi:hypothetical protein
MTIDRTFLENFKTVTPDAFDTAAPSVATVFIDGQLRMQIPQGIETWNEFFEALYRRMIQKFLALDGVTTVVLAFDDHTNSPLAKGPTQAKRRSRSEMPVWSPLQPLPPTVPANYATLLFNRAFKGRVIRYICEQVVLQCKLVRPGQKIVIDYQNRPYVAVGDGAAQSAGEIGEGSPPISALEYNIACPLGESDVKFIRYTSWGDMVLDAVDSDYVAISLTTIERLGHAAPHIFVRRLVLTCSNASIVAAGGQSVKKTSKKRPLDVQGGSAPVKRTARVYEYVDCNLVLEGIRSTLGVLTPDVLKPYTARILSLLIALVGSDFTSGIPYLSGSTAFKNIKLLWPGLCGAVTVDAVNGVLTLNARKVAENVVGTLWKTVQFKKLCNTPQMKNASFEKLHEELSTNTTISAFRRDRLISPGQLYCLVRGCNWTGRYWNDAESCPCAVTGGDFGFVMGKNNRVEFDDKKQLPT